MEMGIDNIVLLIPSLSPDEKLVRYVRECVALGFSNILVINDGSSSEYDLIFDEIEEMAGVTVLKHPQNRGKGRALKTGFEYCAKIEPKIAGVVTADSDGQHSPKDTMRVAKALLQEPDTFILGSRNFQLEQVPFKSRFGNTLTTRFFALLFGRRIEDTQTGLRGIPAEWLLTLCEVPGERFEYEMKKLMEIVREKLAIREITIETIYIEENKETHFDPVWDSIKIYRVMLASFLRYTVSSGMASLVDISVFALLSKEILASFPTEKNILAATVLARIISSGFNYLCNRKLVFHSKGDVKKSALGYFMLVLLIMGASAGLVTLLNSLLPLDRVIIKIMVDTCLFLVSYKVQQTVIFRK